MRKFILFLLAVAVIVTLASPGKSLPPIPEVDAADVGLDPTVATLGVRQETTIERRKPREPARLCYQTGTKMMGKAQAKKIAKTFCKAVKRKYDSAKVKPGWKYKHCYKFFPIDEWINPAITGIREYYHLTFEIEVRTRDTTDFRCEDRMYDAIDHCERGGIGTWWPNMPVYYRADIGDACDDDCKEWPCNRGKKHDGG